MIQRWHIEETGQELTRKKVPGFLNISINKNWTASNVIHLGVFPIVETPKPEITNLEKVEPGERIRVDDEYYRTWIVIDKFKTQEEIDAYLLGLENAELQKISDIAKENLKEIDLKSIRNIREYIATKEDAPDFLKAYEADAINERSKIK